MTYTIDWFENGVLVRFTGVVTLEIIFASDRECYADERYPKIDYGIYDFSDADLSPFTNEDIIKLSSVDVQRSYVKKKFKVAVIATDKLTRSLGESYQYISELTGSSWETRVFDIIEPATLWCLQGSSRKK